MKLISLLLLGICAWAAIWPANALECYVCSGQTCDELTDDKLVSCNLNEDDSTPATTTTDVPNTDDSSGTDSTVTTSAVTTPTEESTDTSMPASTTTTELSISTDTTAEYESSPSITTEVTTISTPVQTTEESTTDVFSSTEGKTTEGSTVTTTDDFSTTDAKTTDVSVVTTTNDFSTTASSGVTTTDDFSTTDRKTTDGSVVTTTNDFSTTSSSGVTTTDDFSTTDRKTTDGSVVTTTNDESIVKFTGAADSKVPVTIITPAPPNNLFNFVRTRRSLAARASDQLIRNYRSIALYGRAELNNYKASACYTINNNGTVERGCIRIPENQSGCQAVRDKLSISQDAGNDNCQICLMDRCNGSGSLRASIGGLFVLLGMLRYLI